MGLQLPARFEELARRAGLSAPPRVASLVVVSAVAVALVWAAARSWGGGGDVLVDATSPGAVQTEPAASGASPSQDAADGASAHAQRSADATLAGVTVHVTGAVRRPGLYTLGAGARVADAVAAAEGLRPDAAEQGVNLARTVQDGEQIVVPTKEELESGAVSPPAAGTAGGGGVSPPVGSSGDPSAGTTVDINSADAAMLETLPGIGPATAQKIVADGEANGRFARPEDLVRVSGIGPKKLEALSGLIVAR